jgi:hypothetical protein
LKKKAGLDFGYIPDFVIWLESLPVLVCEVKSPIVDSLVGYREASLYARHINTGMGYGPGINPCTFVLATNGVKLLYGNWDAEPTGEAQIKDLVPGSDALARLVSFCGISALLKHARREANKLHFGNTFGRPALQAVKRYWGPSCHRTRLPQILLLFFVDISHRQTRQLLPISIRTRMCQLPRLQDMMLSSIVC